MTNRSDAARKAAQTRQENAQKKKRSNAAHKAWATRRRMAAEAANDPPVGIRNLHQHPITTDEIVQTLTRLRDEEAALPEKVGGISVLILDEAIRRIGGQEIPIATDSMAEKRHNAALKAWNTRRRMKAEREQATQAEKRHNAAVKAAATRRQNRDQAAAQA